MEAVMSTVLKYLVIAYICLLPALASANGKEQPRQFSGSASVPELDAGASGAALALLIGGAFVLTHRRRRNS